MNRFPPLRRALPHFTRAAWFGAACVLVAPAALHAQPCPPAPGVAFPEAARRVLERDPSAYKFQDAWIAQTERLMSNRKALAEGRLSRALDPEAIRRMTVVTGTRNVPVFLVRYSNTAAAPITRANLQTELFDGPFATGTMTQYYKQISYGNLDLNGTVYDWVTAANTDAYYEGNSNGLDPASAPIARTGELVTETLTLNDAAVNFGQYDNDGADGVPNSGDDDGFVDFVAIVQPEIGGECGNTNMWSHRWQLNGWPQGTFTTNDARSGGGSIRIRDYVIMPALSCGGGMIEIGVFCHEFGHAFGLPDLYDGSTAGATCLTSPSAGVGHWCLMGSGNWNTPSHPGHMSAWAKAQLGWILPTTVTANLNNWPISSSSLTPTAFKMWTAGTPGTQYFLVEHRTPDGFDDQLHAPGLLVWHVDETVSPGMGYPNNDECHKRLDLECSDQTGVNHALNADNLDTNANRGDATDPFCDGDSFTPASNPSSVSYAGTATTVSITNIVECASRTMRATLAVGIDQGLINICMRDCGGDVCTEPSNCPVWWESPEVYIDNNGDGIIDPPAPGLANQLYARVRNVGTTIASNVNVGFYYADPTLGLLFPSTGTLIANTSIPQIAASSSEPAGVVWNIPVPPPSIDHYCVGVIATHASDGQSSEFAPSDDNVAQINIQALYAKAGDEVPPTPGSPGFAATSVLATVYEDTSLVRVCNPNRQSSCSMRIRIGHPPFYNDAVIPADWTVALSDSIVFLGPGQCATIRVYVRDVHAVHGDFAIVPLTMLCSNEVVVGGTRLEYHIDNVRPKQLCDFTAIKRTLPGHDNQPGERAIQVSWNEGFSDVLGFPERIQRWRLYNGTSATFLPSPANLVRETCIDEEPGNSTRDVFLDIPPDASRGWYKLVAVDRAGNVSDTCVTQVQTVPVPADVPSAAYTRVTLAPAMPNPFRAATVLRFTLTRSGSAQLDVFSVDGRRVRELVRGSRAAGENFVTWDGRDETGQAVAPGVYVARLIVGDQVRTTRMQLVR